MIKIASLPTIAGALLALGLSAAPAHALANRTFVSGKGTDAAACTVTAPCRTFAFALTQTNASGEIDVLDPAGYAPVTTTKAISIVNDGAGVAGIQAGSGATGVTINAGAGDSVHLRGLTIEGLGSGQNGIQFNTGGNLAIENCVIRNFVGAGINISPRTSSSFSVSNTIASNTDGIAIQPTGTAVVKGVLSKVTANNNFDGILVDGSVTTGTSLNVTIDDSVASNNGSIGVFAQSASGHATTAVMQRNVVASGNGGSGLEADTNAILRVAHSVVTGNGTGVATSGGTIQSYGDNDIDGNTNNNTRVLTVIPMH
ncbi:MAG: right-handed parallel beta-helix repeat-containing protein [Pseudomonadota bacterium]|nr:right-handed parallel beta-helix repeat-containing protein [Pseudomonadota bacterium]